MHKKQWLVLASGTLGVFSALGLARFGYTTILPSIGKKTEISSLAAIYRSPAIWHLGAVYAE
jgi:hypothetical protein